MFVVAVDRRSMEDLLFWQGVGRALASARPRGGLIFLHVPGESVDRTLEGEGLDLRGPDGTLRARTAGEAVVLERAVRGETRRIVTLLTECGVPAVGFAGGDRGLLSGRGSGDWIREAAGAGSVPVVASAMLGETLAHELPLSASVRWITTAVGAQPAFFAASDPDPSEGPGLTARDPDTVSGLEAEGITVVLTRVSGLGYLGHVDRSTS